MPIRPILCLFIIAFSILGFGQPIKVLSQSNSLLKSQHQDFIFLSDSTDIDKAVFVAKIQATGSLKNLTYLYYTLKNKAQEMGANAYRLEQFSTLDNDRAELVVSTYYGTEELLTTNNTLLPQNTVYIFGHEDLTSSKTQGYKLNGVKYKIGAGAYASYSLKEGEAYRINKGGFTGTTFWLQGKIGSESTFLSFSGLGLNGADYAMYPNGIGISIRTGKINTVDPNLALLLLKLYHEQKE